MALLEAEHQHEISKGQENEAKLCVFCEIIKGNEPASIIERDDQKGIISFMDLQGYPLVCPIDHIDTSPESLIDNKETLSAVNDLAFSLVPFVLEELHAKGVNVITNIGEAAGQEVPHLHVHLIPRQDKDAIVRLRRMPPLPREELERRATLLARHFSDLMKEV